MRVLMLGIVAIWVTGCASTSAPETVATPDKPPAPVAAVAAPDVTADVEIPARTRDPFNGSVGRPKLPATQPMQRVSTDYVKPKRDPFVANTGQRAAVTVRSNHAADPQGSSRIARPKQPEMKVVSVKKGSAQVSAGGEVVTVSEGDFVFGCRVQSVDEGGVTVTRAGVPFYLAVR